MYPADRPRLSPVRAISYIMLGLAIQVFVGYFVVLPEEWAPLLSILMEIVCYGLPAVLYYQTQTRDNAQLRLTHSPTLRVLGLTALAATIGALFLSNLLALWCSLLAHAGLSLELMDVSSQPSSWVVSLVTMAIVPAVCEELMFRGLLLPSLERRGPGFAIVVSGVIFALMHTNILGLPAHLLLGLLLGLLAWGLNSLWVPMAYHMSHNAFLTLVSQWQEMPESPVKYALTHAETLEVLISCAVLGIGWCLLLRQLLRQGRPSETPGPRARLTIGFWLLATLLILLLAAVYALQIGWLAP